MSTPQLSRLKRFYIVFRRTSRFFKNYCVVEATIQKDAEIYGDVYFGEEVQKVMSASQWWQYKQHNKHLTAVNPEEKAVVPS